MARELGMPDDWLNDSVKGLLPAKSPPVEGSATFTTKGLHVGVASAEYLFAMKAMAARQETDGQDLRVLATTLQLNRADDALDLVERFYGPALFRPSQALGLRRRTHGTRSGAPRPSRHVDPAATLTRTGAPRFSSGCPSRATGSPNFSGCEAPVSS